MLYFTLQPDTDILISRMTSDIPKTFESTSDIETPQFMGPNKTHALALTCNPGLVGGTQELEMVVHFLRHLTLAHFSIRH